MGRELSRDPAAAVAFRRIRCPNPPEPVAQADVFPPRRPAPPGPVLGTGRELQFRGDSVRGRYEQRTIGAGGLAVAARGSGGSGAGLPANAMGETRAHGDAAVRFGRREPAVWRARLAQGVSGFDEYAVTPPLAQADRPTARSRAVRHRPGASRVVPGNSFNSAATSTVPRAFNEPADARDRLLAVT